METKISKASIDKINPPIKEVLVQTAMGNIYNKVYQLNSMGEIFINLYLLGGDSEVHLATSDNYPIDYWYPYQPGTDTMCDIELYPKELDSMEAKIDWVMAQCDEILDKYYKELFASY